MSNAIIIFSILFVIASVLIGLWSSFSINDHIKNGDANKTSNSYLILLFAVVLLTYSILNFCFLDMYRIENNRYKKSQRNLREKLLLEYNKGFSEGHAKGLLEGKTKTYNSMFGIKQDTTTDKTK